jgi:hypothetical protein
MPDEIAPAGPAAPAVPPVAAQTPPAPTAPATPPAPAGAAPAAPTAGATAAAPPAPPPAPGAPGGEQDPNWLSTRLAQAKKNGGAEASKALLKDLGVATLEEAKAVIDAAKKAADERKTELERAHDKIKTLEPTAQHATRLQQVVANRAAAEMGALSEAHQQAVKDIAGDDPATQLETIDKLRKGGMIATAVPAVPPVPAAPVAPAAPAPGATAPRAPVTAPASTTGATGAPAPAGPTNVDHKAVYAKLQTDNPIKAARYAETFGPQIFGA